jgi:hypothetical protein
VYLEEKLGGFYRAGDAEVTEERASGWFSDFRERVDYIENLEESVKDKKGDFIPRYAARKDCLW